MSILKTIGGCLGRFASFPQQCIKNCAAQGYLASVYAKPIHSGYSLFSRCMSSPSLLTMIRNGPRTKFRKPKIAALEGSPQKRGVVLRVIIKKPKKPNSANRKCVRVRLTNGREVYAYVPGEGHNLQEHSIVLVEGARCRDLPAVKLRCVRGKYDLAHVKKKTDSL